METTNYDIFEFLPYNRIVKEPTVQEKIAEIKKVGYIKDYPILVWGVVNPSTGKYPIIDGQHRYAALKAMGLPITYVFFNGNETEVKALMKSLNKVQKQWKIFDYVEMNAKLGMDCYQAIVDYKSKYNFKNYSAPIAILTNQIVGFTNKFIKDGSEFKVNPHAQAIGEFINEIRDVCPYCEAVSFCRALILLFRKGTPEQIEKIRNKLSSVKAKSSIKEYLITFENIANKGNIKTNKRLVLYTEDI